ncbi:hypothetical protein M1L60_09205 [Actinoplanes sp. TRM 88003]|uniref:Uncharacterized protein n=1 Tax=Paractinoplanes aksuensis TaxID=2939490 RepID=A0ABT1DL38_9ACTN|nr:hypothetical protein [Actinoplanes aksuensis]MCO8270771.1 hypothetical protein [Actinoplanes aksuensis]
MIPDRLAEPSAVGALVRVEARRLLRHPALLIGAAAAAWLALPRWITGQPPEAQWDAQTYEQLTLLWSPLHLGAFVAATLTALRPGDGATAEMFAARPLGGRHRTLAQLVAGAIPMALTAVVVSLTWLLIADAGGIPTGFPVPVNLYPTVADAAYVIGLTGAAHAAGIALAHTTRSRLLNVVVGLIFTYIFFFMYWLTSFFPVSLLSPFVSPVSAGKTSYWGTPEPISSNGDGWYAIVRDTDFVACHTVYVAGVGVLLAAHALRRSDPEYRPRRLVLIGGLMAVSGFLLQVLTYSGAWSWPWS